MSHLADTYLHDGNASYAAHLLREALPKLTMPSDVEMSSYFVGLLGQALIQNGQEAEGHHLIGRALGISEGTVKIHLAAIFRALNVRNRTEAVVAAQTLTAEA